MAPKLTQPADQTICSGNATNISLASNLAGTTYDWTVAQSSVSGGADGSGVPSPATVVQTLTTPGGGLASYTFIPYANVVPVLVRELILPLIKPLKLQIVLLLKLFVRELLQISLL